MGVRKFRNSWWVDIHFNRTRYRKRSPENSRSGALAYELVLRQRLTKGEPIDRGPKEQPPTFEQFAWMWFDEYVVANNKYSEQRAKKGILRNTLVPFFGRLTIGKISTHHVEQYKAQQIRKGVSAKTLRNQLTVLRKCLACAHEWLNLEGAPPTIKWPRCPPPRTDYLSPEECELLLSHADGIVYEMILTTLRTGMRQGELKGLQWSSIDWVNRSVAIRHSHCDVRKVLDTPKSNRERHIPLDIDVCEILHNRKENTGYVFTDASAKPFNSPRLNSSAGQDMSTSRIARRYLACPAPHVRDAARDARHASECRPGAPRSCEHRHHDEVHARGAIRDAGSDRHVEPKNRCFR